MEQTDFTTGSIHMALKYLPLPSSTACFFVGQLAITLNIYLHFNKALFLKNPPIALLHQ